MMAIWRTLKGAAIGLVPILVYVGYFLIQDALAYIDHPCRFIAERHHRPPMCADLAACPHYDRSLPDRFGPCTVKP